MKGVYMFLNFSQNFSWVAVGLVCFVGLGLVLLAVYLIYDYCANPRELEEEKKGANERNGYWLYRLAFHFIGELSMSLVFSCLPLYTVSLFYEVLFTIGNANFMSYA